MKTKIPVQVEKAHKAAREQLKKAYAPYSKFKVGSAIIAGDKIYTGCNVENSSFGATICAERVALTKAVSEGAKNFSDIVVVTLCEPCAAPCGLCLQVMAEFFKPSTRVWMAGKKKIERMATLKQLYPQAFTPESF